MSDIIITQLPLSGAVICYYEKQPVSQEELDELDRLIICIGKVFAFSSGLQEEKRQ